MLSTPVSYNFELIVVKIEQLRGMFLDATPKDEDSPQLDDSPPFNDAESPNPGSWAQMLPYLGIGPLLILCTTSILLSTYL